MKVLVLMAKNIGRIQAGNLKVRSFYSVEYSKQLSSAEKHTKLPSHAVELLRLVRIEGK